MPGGGFEGTTTIGRLEKLQAVERSLRPDPPSESSADAKARQAGCFGVDERLPAPSTAGDPLEEHCSG